jgi:hypothetical protein
VQAVDQQPWDPSVKALAAFPTVLGNMDKNLSWTSSLGDAYYNQQADVMDAVQVMRQRAQSSNQLKTTPQQTVTTQGSTIIIQPANPDVVYVPAYNPWLVYGSPIAAWPGWYPYPGIWYGGPYLYFGSGFGIGFFGGYGWGWPRWGFDWHNHYSIYNRNRYDSRSRTFYNRNSFYRGARPGGRLGRGTETSAVMAECTTVRVELPGRLKEIVGRRVDTPHPTARAASVLGPSADTIMAGRPGPFLRAGAPALEEEAEEGLAAAVVAIANRDFGALSTPRKC